MVMLAIAAMTSNVKGEDPTFFLVVAPIANAMWLFGSIGLAVSLKRAGEVPKVVAIRASLPLLDNYTRRGVWRPHHAATTRSGTSKT